METAPQQMLAQSILVKEKRKAQAQAVLNRPASMVPATIAACTLASLGTYLLNAEKFAVPLWMGILAVAGLSISVVGAMDAWTTRRRLEAAITLLQLQQDAAR